MAHNGAVHGLLGVHLAPESAALGCLPGSAAGGPDIPQACLEADLSGSIATPAWDHSVTRHLIELSEQARRNQLHGAVLDIGPVLDAVLHPDSCVRLDRVTTVRISPRFLSEEEPMLRWPSMLRTKLDGGWVHLTGGTDLMGRAPYSLDKTVLDHAVRIAEAHDSDVLAVAAVGALLDPGPEIAAAEYLVRRTDRPIVLSHELGGRRFIERENATILTSSLRGPASRLLEVVSAGLPRVPREAQWALRADGSRIGREEASLFPLALVDTTLAALAQGAAAAVDMNSALVVVWGAGRPRLLTLESGILRAGHFRSLPQLPGVQLSLRHAARPSVSDTLPGQHLTSDLLARGQQVLLVPGTTMPPVGKRSLGDGASTEGCAVVGSDELASFTDYATEFQRQVPNAVVIDRPVEQLCALGAAAARVQTEVVRLAVVEDAEGLQAHRRVARELARGRMLSAGVAPTDQVTTVDQASPLSFLNSGPVLLRVQVVERPVELAP